MMTGLEALKSQAGDYFPAITQIAHASTLVANAVIERKGARTRPALHSGLSGCARTASLRPGHDLRAVV